MPTAKELEVSEGAVSALPSPAAKDEGETEVENESGFPKTAMGRIPSNDGSVAVRCPNCESTAVGTVERMLGIAFVSCLDVCGVTYYNGETKACYDDNDTVRDAEGRPLFACDWCGHQWIDQDAAPKPDANPDERRYYVGILFGDGDAALHGPHTTIAERDDDMVTRWHEMGGEESGNTVFGLNLRIGEDGSPVAELADFSEETKDRMADFEEDDA